LLTPSRSKFSILEGFYCSYGAEAEGEGDIKLSAFLIYDCPEFNPYDDCMLSLDFWSKSPNSLFSEFGSYYFGVSGSDFSID